MKKIFILLSVLFLFSCEKSNTSNDNSSKIEDVQDINLNSDDRCVDYVALWSASDIAEEFGMNKKCVFLNYTVDIWDIPPSDPRPGDIVGELKVQSYARIIDETENDYLVESPMTKVHGWLDKSHVKTISRKTLKTKKLCD